MKTVKILGSGCANCKKLEAVAREAADVHTGLGDRREAGQQRPHPDAGRSSAMAGGVERG